MPEHYICNHCGSKVPLLMKENLEDQTNEITYNEDDPEIEFIENIDEYIPYIKLDNNSNELLQ